MESIFDLQSPYEPAGDQISAIQELVEGVKQGKKTSNITWCNRHR